MSATKNVSYGSQQEAVLSPKEGYMVESVKVINTFNNEEVPSELTQTSEQPPQWTCKFKQPAGRVIIKPTIVPMLYAVEIEENEFCNILLVDSGELSDVSITVNTVTDEASSNEAPVNFNEPQHSFENGVENALDVEDSNDPQPEVVAEVENTMGAPESAPVEEPGVNGVGEFNETGSEPVDSETNSSTNVDETVPEVNNISTATDEMPVETTTDAVEKLPNGDEVADVNTEEPNTDTVYDAGAFADELVDKAPTIISQAEYERRSSVFWDYREALNRGEISEEKFREVERKHNQFFIDIDEGRIVIED